MSLLLHLLTTPPVYSFFTIIHTHCTHIRTTTGINTKSKNKNNRYSTCTYLIAKFRYTFSTLCYPTDLWLPPHPLRGQTDKISPLIVTSLPVHVLLGFLPSWKKLIHYGCLPRIRIIIPKPDVKNCFHLSLWLALMETSPRVCGTPPLWFTIFFDILQSWWIRVSPCTQLGDKYFFARCMIS